MLELGNGVSFSIGLGSRRAGGRTAAWQESPRGIRPSAGSATKGATRKRPTRRTSPSSGAICASKSSSPTPATTTASVPISTASISKPPRWMLRRRPRPREQRNPASHRRSSGSRFPSDRNAGFVVIAQECQIASVCDGERCREINDFAILSLTRFPTSVRGLKCLQSIAQFRRRGMPRATLCPAVRTSDGGPRRATTGETRVRLGAPETACRGRRKHPLKLSGRIWEITVAF